MIPIFCLPDLCNFILQIVGSVSINVQPSSTLMTLPFRPEEEGLGHRQTALRHRVDPLTHF